MRTVIIATEKHIEWINRYHLFLDAFLDPEVTFCQWDQNGDSLMTMVPDIEKCIGGSQNWRAMIIFDDENTRDTTNPFDVVEKLNVETELVPETEKRPNEEDEGSGDAHTVVNKTLLEMQAEYIGGLDKKTDELKRIYDKASHMPLTRLCTYLCPLPLDANESMTKVEKNPMEEMPKHERLMKECEAAAFNHYKQTANYKRRLRNEIIQSGRLKAYSPRDIFCISIRTILNKANECEEQMNLAWKTHADLKYSDFGDRNMYFERMRYFVYDILPENHNNYKFDYLEFICTLLVLSSNRVPSESLQANRLYCIDSDFSENNLGRLIASYNKKLENTISFIEKHRKDIENAIPGPMTDDEAEALFQVHQRIEVETNPDFNMDGFFAEENCFGLSMDCPEEERNVWHRMFLKSDEVMHKLMKQPRRGIERATEELRRENKEESSKVLGLNHFQIEDIKEHVDNEEERMISIKTNDFYDIKRYEDAMSDGYDDVHGVIDTRMTKKITVLLGITAIVVFFVGFIPVIFFNKSIGSVPVPVLLGAAAIVILAIVAYISLYYLRSKLIHAVEEFNGIMRGIKHDVDVSMEQFSKLLSCACNVMKGNYVLNECHKSDNSFKQRIRILGGHIQLIRDRQSDMRELFGEYINSQETPDIEDYFDYNFERVCEYEYPMPIEKGGMRSITFIEDGNKVRVPFDFIDSIRLRMEELYE